MDWRIDGVAVDPDGDYEDNVDSMITSSGLQYVSGTVKTTVRSQQASNTMHFNGAGYALGFQEDTQHCALDMSDCYSAKVMPTITSVSQSLGYTTGG